MSDLSLLLSLPGKVKQVVALTKALVNTEQVTRAALGDPELSAFVTQLKADEALLSADAAAFKITDIGAWFSDLKKLLADFSTVGLQIVSLYESLQTDPAIQSALGTVFSLVSDVAGVLKFLGIKVPFPALAPTKAVQSVNPTPPPADVQPDAGASVAADPTQTTGQAPPSQEGADWGDDGTPEQGLG